MAEKYTRFNSKACRGNETVVIWELEGWKDNLEVLGNAASIVFDVGAGNGGVNNMNMDPLARLQFYFKDFHDPIPVQEYDHSYGAHCYFTMDYSELLVKELFRRKSVQLGYEIKVDIVDDKLEVINDGNSIEKKTYCFQSGVKDLELKKQFIKLQKQNTLYLDDPPVILPQPADLRLKISVTPIFISDTSEDDEEASAKTDEDKTLCHAMKNLFAAEENFSDLKLETKDNMTLSAHKVMLAARSPVLRELIENKMKEDGFKGTIKLPNVNAKPMVTILHWMYSGELHEKAGNCMEEIVDASIAFQLNDLIKILDKKVITICNPENMFQLFGVAKKNGMMTAVKDISQYIKENLET